MFSERTWSRKGKCGSLNYSAKLFVEEGDRGTAWIPWSSSSELSVSCAPYSIFPAVKVTRHSFKFMKNRQEPGSVSFPKAGGDDKACTAPLLCHFISVCKRVLFVFGEKKAERCVCIHKRLIKRVLAYWILGKPLVPGCIFRNLKWPKSKPVLAQ